MLKVLLAEDELIIRNGMVKNIDWNRPGFSLIGAVEDGEQALEFIEKEKPDVLITDIKMPFMDGIELARQVSTKYPEIFIIIISGYDEFQYAQNAIKLKAYDYILKPVDEKYLTEVLLSIKEKLVTKNESESASKSSFYKDFFAGVLEESKITELGEKFGLQEGLHYCVAVVHLDEREKTVNLYGEETIKTGFKNFRKFLKEEISDLFLIGRNAFEFIFLVSDREKDRVKNIVKEKVKQIRNQTLYIEQHTVTIAVGTAEFGVAGLSLSYNNACEALENKYVIGNGQDIFFSDLKFEYPDSAAIIDWDISELVSLIKCSDKKLIEEKIRELTVHLKEFGRESFLYTQLVVSNIYLQAINILKQTGVQIEDVLDEPGKQYNILLGNKTVDATMNDILQIALKISDYLERTRQGNHSNIIQKSCNYLATHYKSKELSLNSVAKQFNMSSCYFSVVFKHETGQTFIDYLTKIRIEKAKELLLCTDMRTYEIADEVGYENSTYFSTLFKKNTGMTPKEFKNSGA